MAFTKFREKIRDFAKNHTKPFVAAATGTATTFALAVPAFAEGNEAGTEYQTVVTAVSNTLSSANLTSVLTYAVGIAIGLVFLWWAVRKVTGILKRAFMRGKLRL